jgi:hypothetical protein
MSTLANLIGYHPDASNHNIRKLLKDLKHSSAPVHELMNSLWKRVQSSFMVDFKTEFPMQNLLPPSLNPAGSKDLDEFLEVPMKNFQIEVSDFKKIKAQLLMKQIQEYIMKVESFMRFVVKDDHLVLGELFSIFHP